MDRRRGTPETTGDARLPAGGDVVTPGWSCETAERELARLVRAAASGPSLTPSLSPAHTPAAVFPRALHEHLERCAACRREARESRAIAPLLRPLVEEACTGETRSTTRSDDTLFRRAVLASIREEPVPVRRLEGVRRARSGRAASAVGLVVIAVLVFALGPSDGDSRTAGTNHENAEIVASKGDTSDANTSSEGEDRVRDERVTRGSGPELAVDAAALRIAAAGSTDLYQDSDAYDSVRALYAPAEFIPSGRAPAGTEMEVQF